MNDLEHEAQYPEQFHSFDFEQGSFNTIYFGTTSKVLKVTPMHCLMR